MIATMEIKKENVNQNQQMIDQKNHMDLLITELYPLENEVVFELLCRCIFKIRNWLEGVAWEGEYSN